MNMVVPVKNRIMDKKGHLKCFHVLKGKITGKE